jgi:hypothetical protein
MSDQNRTEIWVVADTAEGFNVTYRRVRRRTALGKIDEPVTASFLP